MDNSRRNFLKLAAAAAVTPGIAISQGDLQDELFIYSGSSNNQSRIVPPPLMEGSKIAITAPASPSSMWEIRNSLRVFRNMGCEVVIGDSVKNQKNNHRYFSAPDEQRAEEFNTFLKDDSIDCILCARGGYGVMRIFPWLDWDDFRKHPKIIMGYSDITALLLAVYRHSGLVTYHGVVASSDFNAFTVNYIKQSLFSHHKEAIAVSLNSSQIITGGMAEGPLTGGNLSLVISSLGTHFEINTDNAILFLEDVSEEAYKVDRMITHLIQAGKLDNCKGIIFGSFENMHRRRPFYPNRQFSVKEVIEQLTGGLGIPVVIEMPFGHVKNKIILPIGIKAKLDTDKKLFTFLENTVNISY
ncbi:MAG: LD-carboxypeptidase [Candidatus Kapaibacterium sp.]